MALAALMNPGGYLGTDTGTKLYTLEVMDREDTFSPDIGYWAEEHDPSGALHPVHQTRRQDDGSWVGVTTLPMLQLAQPLYGLGGYRLALVLPMLGGVAAAFAARQLARHLDPSSSGWAAFWVIGLGSPVAVYALDFWEHSLGVACVLWAVVVLLGVLRERRPREAVLAGVLLGTGAVMRQEVLVYALIATGVTSAVLLWRTRRLLPPLITGAAAMAGFAIPWYLNRLLESGFQGQSRDQRSLGTASAAAAGTAGSKSTLDQRIEEALQTFTGLVAGSAALSIVLGLAVVGAVSMAIRAERRGDLTFAGVALGSVVLVYLADAVGGLGFIPGLLTAFPLAIGGLLLGNVGRDGRVMIAIGLASLPLIYAFQYLNGASPQWGGRYTLATGSLLGIAALTGLRRTRPLVLHSLVGLSFLVTALGVGWLIERSHGVDAFFDELVAEAEPVVIARQAFLLREGGAAGVGRRWFSVENEQEFLRAVDIARDVGEERVTVLEWEGEAPPDAALPDDLREVRRESLQFINTDVGLVTYEFSR